MKHRLEAAGYRALEAAVRGLDRRRAAALASGLGRFAFDVVGLRRAVAVRNVQERLAPPGGEPEARAIARRSYEVMAKTFVDLLRGDRLGEDELWRLVDRASIESLVARVAGEGAVLVSGHFGNWELAALAIRRLGVPVGAMAADQSNPLVDARVKEMRRRAGIVPISARRALRDALRTLRAGGFVATLMDQDARHRGIFVDFLGRPASTHTGVVSMAMRAGVPLVPGVLVDEGERYRFVAGEIWRPRPDRDEATNLRDGVDSYTRFLEAQVRAAPDNYFWAHRRWKTLPPGEDVA